jgi:glycosyltransferase involved in cell wall biosynthesis
MMHDVTPAVGTPAEAAPVVLDVRVVSGSGGGPDKTILNSPRFLTSVGYRNLCVYMHRPGDPGFERIRARAEALSAPLVSVFDRGPLDWRVVAEMLRICRRERVSIWHGHDYKSNLLGLILRRFHSMRLVTTVHGWVHHTWKTPLYYAVDRLCLPLYERVICVSGDLRDRVRAAGVTEDRCLVIENAIDGQQFRRDRSIAVAKAALGLPTGRLIVGAVGRLSAEKGFDLLVSAIDRLVDSGLDVGLILAGEGDERQRLESRIADLGRGDRMVMLGFRSDTSMIYQAMDIYALSSLREGLPNALLEAMAFEIPVVATRIAGVPRLIRHEENGLLIEPGSVDELASALRLLLMDEAQRKRLGYRGRETIERSYSFEKRMGRIRVLYDGLLGKPSSDGPTSNPSEGLNCTDI